MRKMTMLALALASTTLTAAPAMATADHAGYVGVEAGLLFPNDLDLDFDYDNGEFAESYDYDVEYNMGFDGDIVGGYAFGQFRVEAELGYKTADFDKIEDSDGFDVDLDGDTKVWSLMANALFNPSFGGAWDAYIGVGAGIAWTKFDTDFGNVKDSGFAWQIIAGVGYNISDNIELGLKYRYFSTKLKDTLDDFDGFLDTDVDAKFRSHSLLASLIFSFGSAPPPPPKRWPPPKCAPPNRS